MKLSSIMKHAALGVPMAVLAFGMATNANAVEVGCQPAQVVKAAIQKEGMAPIAVGNRVDGVGNANIFFANSKGYGFNIESDRPFGTPAQNEICVLGTYKNVRVNDPRNAEIPSWLNVKNGDGKTYTDFRKGYAAGDRIVITAQSYTKDRQNNELPGKIVAVSASIDRTAVVQGINSEGYANGLFAMKDFALTNEANKFVVASAPAQQQPPVALAANTSTALAANPR